MIADFGAFVKIKEVLLKKRGDGACPERLITQFRLDYWRGDAWVKQGVFDTEQTEDDGADDIRNIKIVEDGEDGLLTKKVKIYIMPGMTNEENFHGRVGFIAEQLEDSGLEQHLLEQQKQ